MIEGKKVVDITPLLEVFEAQEGRIESWSGRIGNGKTYGAVRRAIRDLQQGKVVYTNFRLDLSQYSGDQRKNFWRVFWNTILFRKRFYNIPLEKNWYHFDLDDSNVVDFLASLTDCVVYADEGQDIFDSYEGTKMSKKKRKSLTRTRHLNKTLVIISQRPQAIAVTARANVNVFYRTIKDLSWPVTHFTIMATEEIDAQNMPLWENEEYKYDGYFASKRVFRTYNTHELRAGIPKSQTVNFEAYDFNFFQRLALLFSMIPVPKLFPLKRKKFIPSLGDKKHVTTLKIARSPSLARVVPLRTGSTRPSDEVQLVSNQLPF